MSLKKKFFTGIEIAVVVLVLGLAGSGVKNWNQARHLNNLAEKNQEQSVTIDGLVTKVKDVNAKKDELQAENQKVQDQLRTKASEGFSVLYEQASDVHTENDTKMTLEHLRTAKQYVGVWGYEAMARVIKWQSDAITANIKQTKDLMEREEKLRAEYEIYKERTAQVIEDTKKETDEHRRTAETLSGKISEFTSQNNWLNKLVFWVIVGAGVYVFFSFGGIGLLMKGKKEAVETAQHYRRKKNQMVKAVKTFQLVNDDGNETMASIITASDDLDMEEEPEDESPVETLKKKKTLPTKV